MINITKTSEFKEELEKLVENTTLEAFLKKYQSRGFGKTSIKNLIFLKILEKEERDKHELRKSKSTC